MINCNWVCPGEHFNLSNGMRITALTDCRLKIWMHRFHSLFVQPHGGGCLLYPFRRAVVDSKVLPWAALRIKHLQQSNGQ